MSNEIEKVCWFPLSQDKWTKVSIEDAARVAEHKWTLGEHQGRFYAYRSGGQRLHRFLTGASPGEEVDHINGDPLDNRRSNLRNCTHIDNGRNLTKWKSKTSSRHKGVCKRPNGKFQAYIVVNKKQIYLGIFDNENDAATAYNNAALFHFGKFAKLNQCD